MRGFALGLSLSMAFVIGCLSARFVVPAARAQGVRRWEHFCFSSGSLEQLQSRLDEAGSEGWELATGFGRFEACMKRPL